MPVFILYPSPLDIAQNIMHVNLLAPLEIFFWLLVELTWKKGGDGMNNLLLKSHFHLRQHEKALNRAKLPLMIIFTVVVCGSGEYIHLCNRLCKART